MMDSVALNGRFLTQPLTGVQRFAFEMTAAIDRLIGLGEWPETTLLMPRATTPASGVEKRFKRIGRKAVGYTTGHLWEQTELPVATGRRLLVSLGNTGPIAAGRRQVVVIHDAAVFDIPDSYTLKFRAWYKTLQRALVASGACIATVSYFSRSRICECLGLDPCQVEVLHEGADHILNVPADPGQLERQQLRAGGYVLVVGSRVGHKNLNVLTELSAALQQRGMVLAVAGSVDPTVHRAGAGGIGGAERLLGRVTDAELRALYEGAVCLVFPSRYEGFGLPPIEAMACGCPVVATSGGAVGEVCGDAALCVDTTNPRNIADAVVSLVDVPGLADDLRSRGQRRAAELSWDSAARCLAHIVRTNLR